MSGTGELVKSPNHVEGARAPSVEESGSEWLERGDHPLLNDLILEILFRLVRRCDLKACRIVCKKWNIRTIPHMRATFRVTIHGGQFDEPTRETVQDTQKIDNFVDIFRSTELEFPFTRFVLGPILAGDEVGQKFLRLCAGTVTEIDLNLNRGRRLVHTIENVSQLLRSSPNLKILGYPGNLEGNVVKLFPDSTPIFSSLKKITFGNEFGHNPLKYCPSAIEELLNAAPNVSDIVVFDTYDKEIFNRENDGDGDEDEDEDEDTSIISALLNCIVKLGRESSIQSLDLRQPTLEHIDHLRRMAEKENGLKLKNLTFKPNLYAFTYYDGIQTQLATIFKDSLQSLNVKYMDTNLLTEFPFMPYLESLALHVSDNRNPKPVDLNKNFPVLETLDLDFNPECMVWNDYFSDFVPCPTIKSFRVHHYSNMAISAFQNIPRVCPNLTKLDLSVDKDCGEIVREIWTQMTGLESLSLRIFIQKRENLDLDLELELNSFLTGIPTQSLKNIRHIVNELEKLRVEERRERILKLTDQHSQLPSIRNLTNLRDLNLIVTGGYDFPREWLRSFREDFVPTLEADRLSYYLTDLTPYLALYSMHHLRHLNVKRCMFTKTCCEILKNEMELKTWTFRNADGTHIIPSFLLH